MKRLLLTSMVLMLFISCEDKKNKEVDLSKAPKKTTVSYVDTMQLGKSTFNKQIICNGKLYAIEKSNLKFKASGELKEIKAHNGNEVKKGQLLAVLDTELSEIALEKAKKAVKKSWIDLTDKLIGQGYTSDTLQVPKSVLEEIKMASGYDNALDGLAEAERNLKDCYLYAPFSGRVANMDSKKYQAPENGVFCTLINDTYFNVEFSLLEAELGEIKVGQKVDISPFINENKEFIGEVTEVNPVVDDKGQVKVRAMVKNSDNFLIEGMNVTLTINEKIENQFVVPKDAVLSRDGYFVVFRYEDGVAIWTYVDVVMSNVDSHVITGNKKKQTKVNANDIIITKGNLNLADGTKVTVQK